MNQQLRPAKIRASACPHDCPSTCALEVEVLDPRTIGRIEGRQLVGAGWVSHLLQQTAAELWAAPTTKKLLARAECAYAERRSALVGALGSHGIEARGGSGLGVWVPVAEEVPVVQHLLDRACIVDRIVELAHGAVVVIADHQRNAALGVRGTGADCSEKHDQYAQHCGPNPDEQPSFPM